MQKNEIKAFENEELGLSVRTVLNEDGSISVNAEDTAIGFGWVQEKKGKIYPRWETLNGFCVDLGFPNKLGKDDYIPESLYYLLGMKANNERAQKYQRWLAMEVLPSLRKTGSYEMPKQKQEKKKKNLSAANMLVKTVSGIFKDAGVDPVFIAAEAKRLYKEQADIDIQIPLITDDTTQILWDCTTIAKELGIYSESGRPHDKAVSAIIQKLDLFTDEIVRTAYSRNGHDGVTVQYKGSVLEKVKEWLEENSYPSLIEFRLANGSVNKCRVCYQEVA